jgi:hypothetical protein
MLSGLMQGLASSGANRAAMAQQADAQWQEDYQRTLGPPPAMIAQEMPRDIQTPVPLSASPAVPTPMVPTAEDILAQIFGRPREPSNPMLPPRRGVYG